MSAVQQPPGPSGNGTAAPTAGPRPIVEPPVLGTSQHTDYYLLDELLTDEQRSRALSAVANPHAVTTLGTVCLTVASVRGQLCLLRLS